MDDTFYPIMGAFVLLVVFIIGYLIWIYTTPSKLEEVAKVISTLPVKGPFTQEQVEAMWYDAGCTDKTHLSNETQRKWWNARTTEEVRRDMKLYHTLSSTSADHMKKCHNK